MPPQSPTTNGVLVQQQLQRADSALTTYNIVFFTFVAQEMGHVCAVEFHHNSIETGHLPTIITASYNVLKFVQVKYTNSLMPVLLSLITNYTRKQYGK